MIVESLEKFHLYSELDMPKCKASTGTGAAGTWYLVLVLVSLSIIGSNWKVECLDILLLYSTY